MFNVVGVWLGTLTEEVKGPWSTGGGGTEGALESWKTCLDWLSERGVNVIVTNLSGAWHGGWAFHHVLDFPGFPEARAVETETVSRNRDLVNQILTHARERGIEIFLHHYNFCAPGSFLLAYPELKTGVVKEQGTEYGVSLPERQKVYGNLCWSNELYQRFMEKVYEEAFHAFPDLAGFYVTIGEPAYCSCERCRDRRGMASHYAKTFTDVHKRAGRRPLIRTWWIYTYFDTMPKGVTYVLKSDECDAVNVPPDPRVSWWMEHGHEVWVTKAIIGENNLFMVWANPTFIWESLKFCEEAGIQGVIGLVTDIWKLGRPGKVVAHLNLEAFTYYTKRSGREAYDPQPWVDVLEETFGPGTGEDTLKALTLQSHVLMNVSRVIGMPWEGYTMWNHHDFFFHPATRHYSLGDVYCTPQPLWRKNILSLLDVFGIARMYQPDPDLIRDYAERTGMVDPLQYMKGMVEEAKEALRIVENLRDRVKSGGMDEYSIILQHIRATVFFGESWLHLLTAKVIFEAVDTGYHTFAGMDRGRYARQAITHFERALESLRRLDELLPLRDPSGNSFWRLKERERECVQLQERLKEYTND
jgi:hypothetical protein